MRINKSLVAFLFSVSWASGAMAQDTNTTEVMTAIDEMAAIHASLQGKTVTMRGAIGTLIGDNLYFKNDQGRFSVQFDAGRNARKSIDGCELEWFGWANSDCIVEVDAEIAIEEVYDFADGGQVKLIVYDVR